MSAAVGEGLCGPTLRAQRPTLARGTSVVCRRVVPPIVCDACGGFVLNESRARFSPLHCAAAWASAPLHRHFDLTIAAASSVCSGSWSPAVPVRPPHGLGGGIPTRSSVVRLRGISRHPATLDNKRFQRRVLQRALRAFAFRSHHLRSPGTGASQLGVCRLAKFRTSTLQAGKHLASCARSVRCVCFGSALTTSFHWSSVRGPVLEVTHPKGQDNRVVMYFVRAPRVRHDPDQLRRREA